MQCISFFLSHTFLVDISPEPLKSHDFECDTHEPRAALVSGLCVTRVIGGESRIMKRGVGGGGESSYTKIYSIITVA